MEETFDEVDFAVAAYREEGAWQVAELAPDVLEDIEHLGNALRRFPGDQGTLALVGLDEDVFLIARAHGSSLSVLLSDITAADEWDLARTAVEHLGLPFPEEDDDEAPAGDLDILGDLGVSAMDMGVLIDDPELYTDEMLSEVADRIGCGQAFDDAVGMAPA